MNLYIFGKIKGKNFFTKLEREKKKVLLLKISMAFVVVVENKYKLNKLL